MSDPDRLLLSHVPPVGFFSGGPRCPEDMCFAACLRAALEYLRELPGCRHLARHQAGSPVSCAYAWYLGVTGHAFSNIWEDGWLPGNGDIRSIDADPGAAMRRGLRAAGHAGTVLLRGQEWPDEGTLRGLIAGSLRAGRPAIGIGIAGPPEPALITGYDEAGAVLMGTSFFQGMPELNAGLGFEPTGEFRARDWYSGLEGLVLLGERCQAPSNGQVIRESIRWAVDHIRTPMINGRHAGLAAYDAWAAQLLDDDAFATDDPAALYARFEAHDQSVGNIAELRWYGSLFLGQAASDEGWMAMGLHRAAACMAQEHKLMWDAWGAVGGIGRDPEKAIRLAEPGVRRMLAEVIRASRDCCAEAAGHLEEALAVSGSPAP